MKTFNPTRISLMLIAAFAASASLADTVPEIEEVVTASRVPTPRVGLAGTVQVLTASDIRNSTANSVQELLAAQVGVSIRSLDGTSDGAVDLRGFGMTASSNTLLLVNGVRQNDNDLSSPRLSQLPLSAIERIEIVRGSGAVQYGGGATGGVINIITKGPFKDQPRLVLIGRLGDYNTTDGSARFNAQGDSLALTVQASTQRTRNYRDNNSDHHDSLSADLDWQGEDDTLHLSVAADEQKLRLPGPLSLAQSRENPELAGTLNDNVTRRSEQLQLGWRHDFGGATLYVDAASRDKDNLAYNESFGVATRDDRYLRTRTITPRLVLPFSTGTIRHRLVAGLDLLHSNATIYGADWSAFPPPYALLYKAKQRQSAIFVEEQATFDSGVQLSAGLRQQRYRDEVNAIATGLNSHLLDGHLHASELGLSVPLTNQLTAFGKVGHSFRLATPDELIFISGAPLKPQRSHDYQVGLRGNQDGWQWGATLYRYDITDEIHFNSLTFANMNLDPTRRQGIELDGTWQVSPKWQVKGNATFQRAVFRSGVYGGVDVSGNEVPLVPRRLASVTAHWQATSETGIDLTTRYVGEQRLDNDQANSTSLRLPAYTVVDLAIGQQYREWSWRFAINNLLDKRYTEYGIRNVPGTSYNLYPSPRRHAMLTLTYQLQ